MVFLWFSYGLPGAVEFRCNNSRFRHRCSGCSRAPSPAAVAMARVKHLATSTMAEKCRKEKEVLMGTSWEHHGKIMGKSWEHGGTNHHQWRFERKKHWTSGLSGLSIVLKYQRIYPEAISIQKACQNVAQKMPQNHPSLKLCTHWNHLSSVPKPCVVPLCSLVDRDSLLMDCDTLQYIYIHIYI